MSRPLLHAIQGTLLAGLLGLSSLSAQADTSQLFRASGMETHQQHFQQALEKAQQRYASQLPASIAASLMRQSNQRFASERMRADALASLSVNLNDAQLDQALDFYRSELGQQVMTVETRATSPAEVSRMQSGVQVAQPSAERAVLLQRLSEQLPALDMGEEVSMALANLATQSANEMLGGLFTIPGELAEQKRGTVRAQMEPNLQQTLAYIYRDLNDQQLRGYAQWSESDAGRAFFRAANAAVQSSLNP